MTSGRPRREPILAIGITGGIGSGKTDVARIFGHLGSFVLSADELARELTETHREIRAQMARYFGQEAFLPDGRPNRRHVAEVIFRDPVKQARLNAIVHPAVIGEIRSQIRRVQTSRSHPIVAVEAALIYEAKTEDLFDYIIVVDAPLEVRIRRLMERDGCPRADILRRVGAQMPAREKAARADFVIQNSGTRATLEENCRFIYHLLRHLASTAEHTTE